MADKKLATLDLGNGRIITALITIPESDGYYECQIVKIVNPIVNDWRENSVVKISKSIIKQLTWNT